ncbi:prepilin peptidase [Microbacterium paludicola]|uniref:Prepilin peptidase n=1 Tax=Microbacterium paludicola TaxID=300019 RepID=A0A4Y9FXK1_9MICO|nr:prepilin peptidase [Microbacterium paludicola]MBF0815269.1 prepilin peptidase [Microbacterium paludicola]TFU34138.1 prepilin peptidase [Microbacterium paludicola]
MSGSDAVLAVAHAGVFAVSLILIRIDIRDHRLPDAIVLPASLGLAALLALAAVTAGDAEPLGRAAAGGLGLFAFYFALRGLFPSGLGGGDVKLAALLGQLLGLHGWTDLAAGAAAAFVLGGIHATVMLATGRASRDTHIAFGPWMIVGAWAGLLA